MRLFILPIAVAMTLTYGAPLRGQETPSDADSVQRAAQAAGPVTDGRNVPWVTKRDFEAAVAGVAATLAVAPFDHHISNAFGQSRHHRIRSLRHTADNVAFFGSGGPFVLSGIVYAAGTENRLQGVARAALHNMEAIALASTITGLAKGVAGRALPDVAARHAFSFGRGFHDGNGPFVSFPSGHTAAAFALAATLGPEVSRASPRLGRVVEPLAFTGAAAVAVARVIQRVHWPSDLPLAVVIGTWSGRAVQAHVYKKGPMAAAVRGLTIAPTSRGGAIVAWSSLLSESLRR